MVLGAEIAFLKANNSIARVKVVLGALKHLPAKIFRIFYPALWVFSKHSFMLFMHLSYGHCLIARLIFRKSIEKKLYLSLLGRFFCFFVQKHRAC